MATEPTWLSDGPYRRLATPAYRIAVLVGTDGAPPLDITVEVDGVRHVATLFTLDSVQTILARYRASGELLGGRYFWAANWILVESVELPFIAEMVADLVASGELHSAFGTAS